ncbi:reverse transcriptase domain-containing protein [Tanacetum coccineum]|uniref:Reverse transcriptase domain-containing protein n=1 Tax=Tanacetum coccineum TaxID=301880 RepID=A0ABQ5ES43_9ASTR
MSAANQWMNFAEIKMMITQRVANAIETIAIYEAKTRMARDSMDRVERREDKMAENASNKRKWEGDHGGSSSLNKEHKLIRTHAVGPRNNKFYAGKLPYCNECKLHHNGPCTAKCRNCKEVGHLTRDYRGATVAANQRAPVANQRTLTCFKCGKQGHYHSECPELKNQNHLKGTDKATRSQTLECLSDESLVIPLDEIQIDDKLHFVEKHVEIMDREVKRLKQSSIPIVKVRWDSRRGREFTWEREDQFRSKYTHLFPNTTPEGNSN